MMLALAVPVTAISSVPIALLRRNMRFRALATQALIASLVAQVVAVVDGAGISRLVARLEPMGVVKG